MTNHLGIIDLLRTLKEASETGQLPGNFPYTPQQVDKLVRDIRSQAIKLQESMERLEEDPKEIIERVNGALTAIEADYPQECKFLNILISQKIAPPDFNDKVMNLMCDLSNAQAGLVAPRQAMIAVQNYVEVLKLIRSDATLREEAAKFAAQASKAGN